MGIGKKWDRHHYIQDSTRKTTWKAAQYTVRASRSPQDTRKGNFIPLVVSLLSLHSLPLLARQLQFLHSKDLCKGHSAGWSPPTPSQDGTASKAAIHMDRKGNPQRPARKMTHASPRKEDPKLDWDTCSLCCWRSSRWQTESRRNPWPCQPLAAPARHTGSPQPC